LPSFEGSTNLFLSVPAIQWCMFPEIIWLNNIHNPNHEINISSPAIELTQLLYGLQTSAIS